MDLRYAPAAHVVLGKTRSNRRLAEKCRASVQLSRDNSCCAPNAIRTVFLVWSPAKRSSSEFHELLRFPFTEMNDDDATTGNRQA